jgi:protein-S-isoprenylcysteine O-methyltransferase Ste14
MKNVTPRLLTYLSLGTGGGGMALFAWFLSAGTPFSIVLARSSRGRLAVDALLSLLFFLQHSGMVRRSVKARIARHVPASYNAALYSIASGLALFVLVLLWQPVDSILYDIGGPVRWLLGAVAIAAVAGFAWGAIALGGFDPFGTAPLRAISRGSAPASSVFVVRGPYRYVRHPLYLFVLILILIEHRVSADRLLFDALWTTWIVIGTLLEERDLRNEFGPTYRDYQKSVPMLIPIPRALQRGRAPQPAPPPTRQA